MKQEGKKHMDTNGGKKAGSHGMKVRVCLFPCSPGT